MLYFCMALLLCFFHGASASRMFTDLDFFGGASLSSTTIVTCERGLCIFPARPRPWMLTLGRNVPLPTTASATKSLSRSRSWLFVAFAAALVVIAITLTGALDRMVVNPTGPVPAGVAYGVIALATFSSLVPFTLSLLYVATAYRAQIGRAHV